MYHDLLRFPVVSESEYEIRFQPTDHFTLSFEEANEPLSPAHFAFEVPYSDFESCAAYIRDAGIPILKWPDGSEVSGFDDSGKSIYFRDGDGNLVEIISHPYIKDGVLAPCGALKVLYLREVGFPVDDAVGFREWFKERLQMKTGEESDTFNFVIGGLAHSVVVSTRRKWIPIAMMALPPKMQVTFGVAEAGFIDYVRASLKAEEIVLETGSELHFRKNGYSFCLSLTNLDKNIPALLNLPYSNRSN